MKTFYRAQTPHSWIDHILISPSYASVDVVTTTSAEGPYWDGESDHRPLCIHLRVPGGRGTAGLSKPHYAHPFSYPLRIDINGRNKKLVKDFQTQLDAFIPLFDPEPTIEIASDQLYQACRMSSSIAKQLTTLESRMGRPRSPFKNGWSPAFMAIKLQRIAMIKILRHASGIGGKRRWKTLHQQTIGIKKIVDEWTSTVHSYPWKPVEEAHLLLDITPYGPSYWNTLDKLVDCKICTRVLALLRDKLQGKQRHVLRLNISHRIRVREDMVACGKLSKYINTCLQEVDPPQQH